MYLAYLNFKKPNRQGLESYKLFAFDKVIKKTHQKRKLLSYKLTQKGWKVLKKKIAFIN